MQGKRKISAGNWCVRAQRYVAWMVLLAAAGSFNPVFAALMLDAVQSRRTHGGAGIFNLNIDSGQPIGGAVTVEPRTVPLGGGHTLVFQFSATVTNAGTASVRDAAGVSYAGATATPAGSAVTVQLPPLPDNRRYLITLAGVNGTAEAATAIAFMPGDVGSSGRVTASDIAAAKAQSGKALAESNFRFDINASGDIGTVDIAAIKSRSGALLPASPTPSVALAPLAGAVVDLPLVLTATAAPSAGTITKVEFFAGATKIGESLQAPFSIGWTPPAAGDVLLTARATQSNMALADSAPRALTVAAATGAAPADAARFLTQATYGPNMAAISEVASKGYSQWINEQFALPLHNPTHWKYVVIDRGPLGTSDYVNAVMESFWLQAVRGPDQLRQRMVLALSEIFVVSTVNSAVDTQKEAHASYLDMLSRNAFGNFRTLIEEVSTHPTMAVYLSSFRNEKEDPATGRQPDENYARELMQLFTVGLWQLNPDGSRKRDANNKFIPTYNQADVRGMARVFTGWNWGQPAPGDYANWYPPVRWDLPMDPYPDFHSNSEKRILNGVVIPANTNARESLRIALDTLFNHPNVGPFIGSQLIKRFVTSNPSSAYVSRVSAAFDNNGSGVRGDMKAVLRAVLLDPEARDSTNIATATWGKLREPMIRYGNFMRAFDVKSTAGLYELWNLEDPISSLGQNPLRAPSVFNWYRPDYAPPGPVLSMGLVAPEFQIAHETTVTGYTNFMTSVAERQTENFRAIASQYGPVNTYLAGNVSAELALADQPDALLDRLSLLLLGGRMSSSLRTTLRQAILNVPVDSYRWRDNRVSTATLLIMAGPEYVIQK